MIRLTLFFLLFLTVPLFSIENLQPFYSVKAPEGFTKGKEAFARVFATVKAGYYDGKGLSEDDLYYAAIQGMLRKISPPKTPTQSKIWSVAEKKKALGSLKTKQLAIGIKYSYDRNDGSMKIRRVEENSPAMGKLLVNDRIMRINDKVLKNKTIEEISKLLSGKSGELLKFKVVRDIKVLEVIVVLKSFKRKYSRASEVNGVGYVRLLSFSDKISTELKEHVEIFRQKKMGLLIIDLRHNTGGYFNEAIKSAELFLKKGSPIVSVVRSGSKRTDYTSLNSKHSDVKIAILIDKYSASSSEVLAAALRKNNRAVLIGKKSYGKAITEKTFDIKNKYYIKFTVGAMYDIEGGNWHETGLIPDLEVSGKILDDPASDRVVLKAIEYLKKRK
jgi:carboxyl-terminal processing protease